jgi:hypothetical protein
MLPHQGSGKAVGINPGLALAVGDFVELAVCLAEWLLHSQIEDAPAPLRKLGRF